MTDHDLHELVVEATARRVVELLREEALPVAGKPLTVAQVAEMFGRSHEWVRDHRAELGVLPATGTRPRLIFDARRVGEFMRAPTPEATESAEPHARRRRRSRSTAALLPIRGRAA